MDLRDLMENQLTVSERKKRGNKIALIFVAKLFLVYFFLSEGNKFMFSATSPGGRFYHPFVAEYFNYIQGLRNILIIPSTWIIKAFGFMAYRNATELMIVDGPILMVNYDCLGLGVMSFLIAFCVAFPAEWKAKVKLLIFTVLTVYVLNVFRISGLALLLKVYPNQQQHFTYHHEIFNITIYVVIFLILYFWIRRHTIVPTSTRI